MASTARLAGARGKANRKGSCRDRRPHRIVPGHASQQRDPPLEVRGHLLQAGVDKPRLLLAFHLVHHQLDPGPGVDAVDHLQQAVGVRQGRRLRRCHQNDFLARKREEPTTPCPMPAPVSSNTKSVSDSTNSKFFDEAVQAPRAQFRQLLPTRPGGDDPQARRAFQDDLLQGAAQDHVAQVVLRKEAQQDVGIAEGDVHVPKPRPITPAGEAKGQVDAQVALLTPPLPLVMAKRRVPRCPGALRAPRTGDRCRARLAREGWPGRVPAGAVPDPSALSYPSASGL